MSAPAGGRFVSRTLLRTAGRSAAAASRYAVWLPAADAAAEAAERAAPLPVVLFLHGAGERGTDGVIPTTVGIRPVLEGRPEPVNPIAGRAPAMTVDDLPPSPRALVVCPQVRPGDDWTSRASMATALAALDATLDEFDGDPARQSLTGISMGGSGAWHLALRHPDRFAALVPVCGWLARDGDGVQGAHAADPHAEAAAALRTIPIWVFHGSDDRIIPVDASRVMVAALRTAGADVRYTEYPGVGHASWRQAYADAALYPWLLTRRRVEAAT